MDTRGFLETLFGDKPQNSYITIFTLPNQKSKFFQDIDQAAVYVQRINNQQQHIYFGTNLQGEVKLQGRGKANDSIGTVCFYTDVDMECPSAHSKCDLPKNEQDAYSILKGFGWDPSLIVHSGFGLHVYWIFKEPWIFEDDTERERYHRLLIRLQATIREQANKKGWTLDYTNDLARILRVPGTYNIKVQDNPIEVKVIESSGLRYNPEDIEAFLINETAIQKSKSLPAEIKSQIQNGLVLDASAEAPEKKLETLLEINEDFKATWNGSRREFHDDPSRFAQSLANIAAQVNWTDQEICNLLIHFYRKHLNTKLFVDRKEGISMDKIMRPSKIALTLGKARISASELSAKNYVENIEPAEQAGMGDMADPGGKHVYNFLEGTIRLKITSLKKYIPDDNKDPFYEMWVDVGGGSIKTITFTRPIALLNQTDFRYRVSGAINILPRAVDKTMWERISNAFLQILEEVTVVSSTATVEGRMKSWVEQYLDKRPAIGIVRGHAASAPFVHRGFWYIFPKPFKDWAFQYKDFVDNLSRLQIDLKRVGAVDERVDYKHPEDAKKRVQFRAWKIPHEIVIPPPTVVVDNTKSQTMEDDEPDAKVLP
jgi:hypothetical protein